LVVISATAAVITLALLRWVPTAYALLPLPLLAVYSVAAYSHAERVPRIGIGCAAHQLPATFTPTCYFDSDGDASGVFSAAFPSDVCAGSFAEALLPDSPFVRCAKLARVGFASPPCTDISIVNPKRQESSACSELTVDCVRALRYVRHEVLCLETTTTVASARGGRLLQSIYDASNDVDYWCLHYSPALRLTPPLSNGGIGREGSRVRRLCRWLLALTSHSRQPVEAMATASATIGGGADLDAGAVVADSKVAMAFASSARRAEKEARQRPDLHSATQKQQAVAA
jgi:hypothetical protein